MNFDLVMVTAALIYGIVCIFFMIRANRTNNIITIQNTSFWVMVTAVIFLILIIVLMPTI